MLAVVAGSACVAPYSLDGAWYRAEILSTGDKGEGSDRAGIRFIDYGSFEFVPRSKYEILHLYFLVFFCGFYMQYDIAICAAKTTPFAYLHI